LSHDFPFFLLPSRLLVFISSVRHHLSFISKACLLPAFPSCQQPFHSFLFLLQSGISFHPPTTLQKAITSPVRPAISHPPPSLYIDISATATGNFLDFRLFEPPLLRSSSLLCIILALTLLPLDLLPLDKSSSYSHSLCNRHLHHRSSRVIYAPRALSLFFLLFSRSLSNCFTHFFPWIISPWQGLNMFVLGGITIGLCVIPNRDLLRFKT